MEAGLSTEDLIANLREKRERYTRANYGGDELT
jgi:hypothetical protein